jgi:hypothetical protein
LVVRWIGDGNDALENARVKNPEGFWVPLCQPAFRREDRNGKNDTLNRREIRRTLLEFLNPKREGDSSKQPAPEEKEKRVARKTAAQHPAQSVSKRRAANQMKNTQKTKLRG